MQICINLKIFIFLIMFYFNRQIKIYAMLMMFAFFHELGHLLAGVILGFKPESIKIMPFGISIAFKIPPENYNKKIKNGNLLCIKKIIVASSGPLINLIIILICLFNFDEKLNIIIYSNILIGIFNILPIYPLDGGRILKEILHINKGIKESYIYINKISNIVVIILTALFSVLIYYYKNIYLLLLIFYIWGITLVENKNIKTKVKIYNIIDNQKKNNPKSKINISVGL